MKNPFGSQQIPGSYVDLRKRMFQHVQDAKVNDQIFEIVKTACDKALMQENVVLYPPERDRMLSQIIKMVLEDMLKKLDKDSSSGNA
jgi:hypothetical protein